MERKTIDVIIGKPVDAKEVEKADKSQVGEGHSVPPKGGEVGGRLDWRYVECPYCRAINLIWVEPGEFRYYWCWNTLPGKHYFTFG